jgi:branched-chain amino acid aminotransferase
MQGFFIPMGNYISFNGNHVPASQSFRYGEGVFETMRLCNGSILLEQYHFDRLLQGMAGLQLQISPGLATIYKEAIHQLCQVNRHDNARVRLTVFKDENGLSAFIAESWDLDGFYHFNEQGLTVDIYPEHHKSMNTIAACKSTIHTAYALAATYASAHGWDDCLVLNEQGNICDSSISNVFWIKDGIITTPPLSEGCIAGVLRRFLLANMEIIEHPLTVGQLLVADEVFLTNVIRGIRPVKRFSDVNYKIARSKEIFHSLIEPLCR